jgi:hypothetical protein
MDDLKRHADRVNLGLKGAVLALSLAVARAFPGLLPQLFTHRVLLFRVYHLIWLGTVLFLIKRMIPAFNRKIASSKQFGRHYRDSGVKVKGDATRARLKEYTRRMNLGAVKVAVCWALVVIASGGFYYLHILGATELFIIVIFFIFMDQFCMSVWCPFLFIIGNKCCNTCRINNWGYLMAFAPLVFLPSFWTLSVVCLSAVLVVQWEYLVHTHPERFYELCNARLTCRNCPGKCRAHAASHKPALL